MLKYRLTCGCLAVLLAAQAPPALAQDIAEAPASAVAAPVAQDPPLTVSNVTVDKVDKNAVLARKAAITEARRLALQKLAERVLSPEDYKNFELPEDSAISAVVQDFEITSEQLSKTRYVATFTVRFRPSVKMYFAPGTRLEDSAAESEDAPGPKPAVSAPRAVVAAPSSILVLPYLETAAGALMLWEDANGWLKAWQDAPPAAPGWTVSVPLGDIGDVAAGSSDAVWSDDFTAVEKLRGAYGADEVVIAVANASGPSMTVDLYIYKAGRIERRPSLAIPSASPPLFAEGVRETMNALLHPQETPLPAERDGAVIVMPEAVEIPVPAAATSGGPVALDAEMHFDSFASWMEAQKRLAALNPPAALEIRSITSTSASFTLKYSGSLEALKTALEASGIALSAPAIEVGESIPGSAAPTQRPLYELQLLN